MVFLKRNYGWLLVLILAGLPLLPLSQMVSFDTTTFSVSLIEGRGKEGGSTLDMLYHISGEFAIRWMTAVLTCTPFFILFGIQNLFVRQAMGIATGVWSLLHFIIFLMAEGFLSTFDELNYIMGFIAVAILVPLLVTSNRKSMKKLKSTWKKLQSWVYLAVILSLLHVALLEKIWLIYALIVAIGFILRITPIKNRIIAFRTSRKN